MAIKDKGKQNSNLNSNSNVNTNKVTKYRKPLNINIGIILFLGILVYVVYSIFSFMGSKRIVRYEVKEGSLAVNSIYEGIVIRDEKVMNTSNAGYVNFYAYEGERVAVGDLVYTIDETGKLNEILTSAESDYSDLTDKELRDFKNDIQNYQHSFQNGQFKTLYDFKHMLNNSILKLANRNMLNNATLAGNQGGIQYCYSPNSGIVSFWVDGYESKTPQDLTEEDFKKDNYDKKLILPNTLLGTGDEVYKVSGKEHWKVVIPVDEARADELEKEEVVKVRFLKNQYESWANVEAMQNADGKYYVSLEFTNSMVTFSSDRFLDIELILHDQTGLKIPLSSIVEKEFFLVDENFVFEQDSNHYAVIRQCYLEDGSISTENLDIEVYSYDADNKEYYLDASLLNAGDILHQLDSQNTYVVSKRANLIGVYNMNKGYADFKEIQKLYENEEYAIIRANTTYGLNVYDYIVLDAKSVTDDQFINQ